MYPTDRVAGIIEFMDRYGVEKIAALGSPSEAETNERILRLRGIAPDRVIGGPYIDPREPDAREQLVDFHAAGCRLVKLFPNLGYYPDDERFLPFFEEAAALGLGFLSHCGWLGSTAISSTKYARPGRFEKVFRRFPETLFIMAHMGGIDGFLEGIMYTARTPNVYLDTTPGQSYWVFENAGSLVRGMPRERLLLGSDGIAPPYEDGTDCSGVYGRVAGCLEGIGWGGALEEVFYGNPVRVIEEYGLLP